MTQPIGFPYGDPRAYIERDFARDTLRIHLAVRTGDNRMHILDGNGVIHTREPNEAAAYNPDERAFLTLPDNLARALLDALAAHFGGTSEVQTLRKDYLHERGRVDKVLDYLIRTAS